jgi:hypothetical protein
LVVWARKVCFHLSWANIPFQKVFLALCPGRPSLPNSGVLIAILRMWSPRRSDERIPYQKVWDVSIVTMRSGKSVLCASSAYQTAGNMHFATIFQYAYFASFSQTLWIPMEACAGTWNLWAKSEKFKIPRPTSTRIKGSFFDLFTWIGPETYWA